MSDNPFSSHTREIVGVLSKMDRKTMRAWLTEIQEYIMRCAGPQMQSIHDYLTEPDSARHPFAARHEVLRTIIQALKDRDTSLFHHGRTGT